MSVRLEFFSLLDDVKASTIKYLKNLDSEEAETDFVYNFNSLISITEDQLDNPEDYPNLDSIDTLKAQLLIDDVSAKLDENGIDMIEDLWCYRPQKKEQATSH